MSTPASLDLAVTGNCEVAALIDTRGRMVWACVPRPDGDPAFCGLLHPDGGDAARGVFAVDTAIPVHEQSYRRNTAIAETSFRDATDNAFRIIDFCPRFREHGRMFRPMMFIRLIEPLQGRPRIRLRFVPAVDYGARAAQATAGGHHVTFDTTVPLRVTTNASISALLTMSPMVLDGPLAFVIGANQTLEDSPLNYARSMLDRTEEYWLEWVRSLAVPVDWADAVIRAAITLKLCTYEDTGAVLAALTTSIPESAEGGRTWDYRFCWLRDAVLVIRALNRLGATRTMEGFLRYIGNVVEPAPDVRLRPLYPIAGNAPAIETVQPSLAGYRGIGPVRVGNGAYDQLQNDVYGAVVLAATQLFFDRRLVIPEPNRVFLRMEWLGQQALLHYEQPDSGPWELRGTQRVHTLSAVMCWCACDRLARIAFKLGVQDRGEFWSASADRLRARILERAWNESQRLIAADFGGSTVDASVLLLPEFGFLAADDPRFRDTLAAVERDLKVGDLIYRYRIDDDFGRPAHAFTVCSFWYINALDAAGRRDQARQLFEQLLSRRNPLGLFSEHIDPVTFEQWGNYPQTYSMVGIISSAVRLSRAWEDVL